MRIDEIERELKDTENTVRAANDCFGREEYAQAYELYKMALPRLSESFGAEDSRTIACLLSLGDTCYTLERFDEAARSYHQALTVKERSGQLQDHEYPRALFKLARAYARVKPGEADKYFTRAVQSARQCLLAGDPLIGKILEAHASFLNVAGRAGEAEALIEEARTNRQKFGSSSQVVERYLEPLVGQTTIPPGTMRRANLNPDPEGFKTLQLRPLGRREGEHTGSHQPLPAQSGQPTSAPPRTSGAPLVTKLLVLLAIVLTIIAGIAYWRICLCGEHAAAPNSQPPQEVIQQSPQHPAVSPDAAQPPAHKSTSTPRKLHLLSKPVKHVEQTHLAPKAQPKKDAPASVNRWQDLKQMRRFD